MDISLASLSRPKFQFRPPDIGDETLQQHTTVAQVGRTETQFGRPSADPSANTVDPKDTRPFNDHRPVGDRTLKPYDTLMLPYDEAETSVSLLV